MPIGLAGVGAAAAASLLLFGGYRLHNFIRGMQQYREHTKSETVTVAANFLRLLDAPRKKEQLHFFRINDEVMGGRSTSVLAPTAMGGLLFTGLINTNGGGFASCRTLGDDKKLGLSGGRRTALLVDASGDGSLYKATLHTADSWEMGTPSWSHDFLATRERATYRLPLSAFIPSKQGRVVRRGAPLDASRVTGVGFSLSLYTADGRPNPQFGDGPFSLEVHGVQEVPSSD